MAVTVYRSTDASAPVLSGTAGALIGVLDACLVTGYGAKSAAGWTKDFSGTNLATYRAPTGNRMYLRVDDTGTQTARVRGYETMSDVNTGTGPFPTDAQVSGGAYFYKSSAASAASRSWWLYTNGTIVYLYVDHAESAISGQMLIFGDFTSYVAGDAFNTILIASTTSATTTNGAATATANVNASAAGNWVPRSYTQSGTSVNVGKHGDAARMNGSTTLGNGGIPYPSPDSMLWMSPVYIHEPSPQLVRGVLPGVYAPCHAKPFAQGDTFSGTGEYSGRTFEALYPLNASTAGQLFFETSNTW